MNSSTQQVAQTQQQDHHSIHHVAIKQGTKHSKIKQARNHAQKQNLKSLRNQGVAPGGSTSTEKVVSALVPNNLDHNQPHLYPRAPILPIFTMHEDHKSLIDELINNGKPTIAGIISYLQQFQLKLHALNDRVHAEVIESKGTTKDENSVHVITETFKLIEEDLMEAFDKPFRGRPIFPIREEEESIFLSLASFREHMLTETMIGAFKHAKNPDQLYIGAIVQNCFGRVSLNEGDELNPFIIDTSNLPCRTGAQVIGKDKNGRDQTKVSDAPPDVNGIEEFCNDPDYKKYCDAGQIRVLYVHETESLGPAMARYYASKLWGGETYFMQTDSHLQFAEHWDEKYINEIKSTNNYPKSVLSSYPPGFNDNGGPRKTRISDERVNESSGARLCTCEFSKNAIEEHIVRVNTGRGYSGFQSKPMQIPFIAAGFFFTHSQFLVDVPFDPYMPWCFMGEEIALSMRAWTSGFNIYAPLKNYIAHHYRPGRLGLPKFWGSVNRLYKFKIGNNLLQSHVVQRVKNMVGYPSAAKEVLEQQGYGIVLKDQEHYGLGTERSLDKYMEYSGIDAVKETCSNIACKSFDE